MYNHKEPWKKYPVSMLYIIAEPDKAYDECHHLLNPFKSNETSHFYQMNKSIFVFRVVGCVFFILIQILTSCKQTVENLIRHCRLWSLILACTICLCPTKNASLIWVKYFCCVCYSHQLYCFFIELDNDWICSGFNHMNRHGICHMWDRNRND